MRRRSVLAGVPAAILPAAGCLSTEDGAAETSGDGSGGSTDRTDRRYAECGREVIPADMFPEPIQAEIDAALDGSYEAERVFLGEAMDVDESYVSVDGTYYEPSITDAGDGERLELAAVEPKALPQPRSVSVENRRDGERTITLSLSAEDGTMLVEETRSLHPGGDVEFGELRRVGTHELRVTVDAETDAPTELTEPITVHESLFGVRVVVETDEIYLTETVADLAVCQFTDS